jgi:transposase
MQAAAERLGEGVLRRTLAFAWHLQGAETRRISRALDVPADTLNGLFKRVLRDGLPALEDRRHTSSAFLPPAPTETRPDVRVEIGLEQLSLSARSLELQLDRGDGLLCRAFLFVFLGNGLVQPDVVATALDLSVERVRKLRAGFRSEGAEALVDRRRGQVHDYSMPQETKAELICQYVAKVQEGCAVNAPALKAAIEEAGKSCPSPQTLRLHVEKLGLSLIQADEDGPATPKRGLRTT